MSDEKAPHDCGGGLCQAPVRYTHRVAISNSRLISADAETVAFRWKDYRMKTADRQKVMRFTTDEFIRCFLIHVLPDGFHRIRHYSQLADAARKANVAKIRTLLGEEAPSQDDAPSAESIPLTLREPCPDCGGPMRIVEIFRRGQQPRSRAPPPKGRRMISCLPSASHRFRSALPLRTTSDPRHSMPTLKKRPRFFGAEPHATGRARTGSFRTKPRMIDHFARSSDLNGHAQVFSPWTTARPPSADSSFQGFSTRAGAHPVADVTSRPH